MSRIAMFEDYRGPGATFADGQYAAVEQPGNTNTNVQGVSVATVRKTYAYQSFFDDAQAECAIRTQPPNEPIVPSTVDTFTGTGYSVGLHPASETPIAIEFFGTDRQPASGTVILLPGQTIRPGGTRGPYGAAFSGFRYGLPYGWLGGGAAMLSVFQTPEAHTDWAGQPEFIFQRVRLPIQQPGSAVTAANMESNWPTRFPFRWAKDAVDMFQGSNQASLVVRPTRTLLRLRKESLTTPALVRAFIFNAQAIDDLSSAAAPALASFVDITFPAYNVWHAAPQTYRGYPLLTAPDELTRLGGDGGNAGSLNQAHVAFHAEPGSELDTAGMYLDIVRFGVF